MGAPGASLVSIVVITRNRAAKLRRTLAQLAALPGPPPIIVVDNASTDETRLVIAAAGPKVHGIALRHNAGSAGRNAGVARCATPYVAFADDDSWWAPGAFERASGHFQRCARLGLIAGRMLVGVEERLDPVCAEMDTDRLGKRDGLPGPGILGFMACGAIVRREAFLACGGFHARFGVGGEEGLLAIDLARRGWGLAYCEDVVAHHHPDVVGERPGRRAQMVRNDLWTAWLRLPPRAALRATGRAVRVALRDPAARQGLLSAAAGLHWVIRERASVDRRLGERLALLRR